MGLAPGQRHEETKKKLTREERRRLVAANIIAGATYAEIALALDVSKATIANDYKAIIENLRGHYEGKFAEFLAVQLRRYDTLLNVVWDKASKGDLACIDRALAVMDRQNRLLGLGSGSSEAATAPVAINVFEITGRSRENGGGVIPALQPRNDPETLP